ncbi:hypothetical protein IF2G_11025 [Cordyceps javanica]|nr:hypothetical protein IF2G_11025 [Cordyceps javanica]
MAHIVRKKHMDDCCTECVSGVDTVEIEVNVPAIARCNNCLLRVCGKHFYFAGLQKRLGPFYHEAEVELAFRKLMAKAQIKELHRKFSQVLVLVALTSTRDARSIERLREYQEDDIISLVWQSMHQLQELPRTSNATQKHHAALIQSVFELCSGVKNPCQWKCLDASRTFQQNRQMFLSMLGIDVHATCVDITEITKLAGQCKVFQLQPELKAIRDLLNPAYLPILPLQSVHWKAACNLTYDASQRFSAFAGSISHQFSYNEPSEPDYLFIIFRYLENTLLQLDDEYLKIVQSRLADKIRSCEIPNRLVVYVIAAFISSEEATTATVHDFVNENACTVSRETISAMTRALNKAMRSWPTQEGSSTKFVLRLLGDTFHLENDKHMPVTAKTPNDVEAQKWDIYWDSRMREHANHDLARAFAKFTG